MESTPDSAPETPVTSPIVLLNGPPGCGKDAIADYLVENYGYHKEKFAAPLHAFMESCYAGQVSKDTYIEDLGSTGRELMISLSEDWAKVEYGPHFFGVALRKRIEAKQAWPVVISDAGFLKESLPLCHTFRNVCRVGIFRNGCSFNGDSRSYWSPPHNMPNLVVYNDFSVAEAAVTVVNFVSLAFNYSHKRNSDR